MSATNSFYNTFLRYPTHFFIETPSIFKDNPSLAHLFGSQLVERDESLQEYIDFIFSYKNNHDILVDIANVAKKNSSGIGAYSKHYRTSDIYMDFDQLLLQLLLTIKYVPEVAQNTNNVYIIDTEHPSGRSPVPYTLLDFIIKEFNVSMNSRPAHHVRITTQEVPGYSSDIIVGPVTHPVFIGRFLRGKSYDNMVIYTKESAPSIKGMAHSSRKGFSIIPYKNMLRKGPYSPSKESRTQGMAGLE